jgi:hypothetical protein
LRSGGKKSADTTIDSEGNMWIQDVGEAGPTKAAEALLKAVNGPWDYPSGYNSTTFDTGEIRP